MLKSADVLDHGFVRLLNVAGPTSDEPSVSWIAKSARTSFANHHKDRTLEDDIRLSKYLWRNEHMSPFEMVETWWEVKAPIFVVRQWHRHRTASISEISGRYVSLPDDWYIPDVVGGKPVTNKQGRSESLHPAVQSDFRKTLQEACEASYSAYLHAVENGVTNEQARMLLHQNHYTQFLWKTNLRNLLHFLKLRTDGHAQWEIRQYAEQMQQMIHDQIAGLKEVIEEVK